MRKNNKYVLVKKNSFKKISVFNYEDTFDMSKKKDKMRIGIIKFYDEKIIADVIKRSIDNRFKKFLELIASIDESDADPSNGYLFCLDEASKFKQEMVNKYNKFLKKNQIEFINKKIELMEKEVKNKLITYRLMHSPIFDELEMDEEIVEERSRRR